MLFKTVRAVLSSETAPTATEPVTAARLIVSVTPAGMLLFSCAVIFFGPAPFVVRVEYVVSAFETAVGAAPAVAAVIFMAAGEPETVSDCDRAGLAMQATRPAANIRPAKRQTGRANQPDMASHAAGDGERHDARRRADDAGRGRRVEGVAEGHTAGVPLGQTGHHIGRRGAERLRARAGRTARTDAERRGEREAGGNVRADAGGDLRAGLVGGHGPRLAG